MSTEFAYLESAERTDVGKRRKNNEDAILSLPRHGVFCVADGMGGVQGGEVASKATVDALSEAFTVWPEAQFALTAAASARLVERSLNKASRWIKNRGEERGITGTGSTAVVLVFDRAEPARALVLHAGDSRAYRYRADKLTQLSTDHSVAAAAGLPDDNSLPAMFRGVITRAVGLDRTVALETTPADVAPGDLFLLCSDGLTKMLTDRQLQKLLRHHRDDAPEQVAGALIDEALKHGGEDNVSAIVVRVSKDLPQGPTLTIPPETRAIEDWSAAEADESGPMDQEPPTANETGQTVDLPPEAAPTPSASPLLSDAAEPGCITPTTPTSGHAGVTPTGMNTGKLPDPAPPPRRGTRWLAVGGIAILVIAAALAIWALLNR